MVYSNGRGIVHFIAASIMLAMLTSTAEASCLTPSTLLVSPKHGNMLGGTPVTVTIASEDMERITGPAECVFDGDKVTPAVESAAFVPRGRSYLCATPSFDSAGKVSLEFRAPVENNQTLSLSGCFFTILPPYSCPDLDVLDVDTLKIDSDIRLSWKNEYSVGVPFGCADICVDINLHILVVDGGDKYWITHNIRNGTAQSPESISYENDIKVLLEGFQVYAAVFEARITIKALLTSETFTFSRWSGVYIIPSEEISSLVDRLALGSQCTMPDPGDTTGLPDCPLTDFRARRFNTGFDEEIAESTKNAQYREHYYSYLHPMSNSCFVQHQDKSAEPRVLLTQQCCYDENGLLLVDPKEAHLSIGTPLYQDTASMVAYYRDTVLPFIHCCKEGVTTDQSPSQCRDYQSKLPVNTGSDGLRSEPHPQCAAQVAESSDAKRSVRSIETRDFGSSGIDIGCGCPTITTYTVTVTITISPPSHSNGDPHISTPDGLQYTFNGKGEFTYVETMDGSFVAQCRLEQATGTNGTLVAATLFTAIVAKTNTSDKVQMSLVNGNDIEVLVNDCVIDLSAIRWKQFAGVGLTRTTNGSVVASFTGGYFVEVRAEHDMLSLIKMSFPDEARGQTQGLIGNYNCDPLDDLIPKGMSEPIPANSSSFEDVHYNFGLTWLLKSSNESLFCYKDSENFSTFHDPDFIPSFEPIFNNSELEEQAIEMCGDNRGCMFDVAATGRLEVGNSALEARREEETDADLAIPIVCDPPCVNGACVANDTCQCSPDYTGPTCDVPVMSGCDMNVCQNGGTCCQHSFTYTCECPIGYGGEFCEEECTPTVDLCLAVDTSRSIKNFQIQRQNQALSQFAEQLNVGTGRCQSRVAAVVYGNGVDMSFGLSDYTDSPSLAATLGNLPRESNYRKGGTRTDLALEKCAQILEDEGQSGKCNQKVIIVFLDGKPHPRNANLAAILGNFKSQGIKVVAVGASTRTPREDLLELALDEPDNVIQSDNFFGLTKIVPDIIDSVNICPQCGK